jgi:hypothetical protein
MQSIWTPKFSTRNFCMRGIAVAICGGNDVACTGEFHLAAFSDGNIDCDFRDATNESDRTPGAGKTDKKVKSRRRKSMFRDAMFIRKNQEHKATLGASRGEGTSVYHSESNSEPELELVEIESEREPEPTCAKSKRISKVRPWYEANKTDPARKHRVPAEWRDICDLQKADYLHEALKMLGPVHSLSANLSPDIEAKALAQANALDWLRRRISHHLKTALKRQVEFWIVPEEGDHHRLHLHGEIGVDASEAESARKAIRKACGEWKETRQHQVHTSLEPDAGWPGYVMKDAWKMTPYFRNLFERANSRKGVRFQGGVLSKTRKLGQQAEKLYTGDRDRYL